MNKCGRKNPPRAKIIPDPLFYELWNVSYGCNSHEDFFSTILKNPPKGFKNFMTDYKVTSGLMMTILEKIYDFSHMSAKEVFEKTGKKKAELRDIFCIPLRTLEDWCYNKSHIPTYAKLMMLKHFHLLNLGNQVYLESEVIHEYTKPKVYVRHEEKRKEYQEISPEPYDIATADVPFSDKTLSEPFLFKREDESRQKYADNKEAFYGKVSENTDSIMEYLLKNNPRAFRNHD